jgi:hypothetical protein
MEDIWAGDFTIRLAGEARAQEMRVVNWNIDRGLQLDAITDFLNSQRADLVLLQEVDVAAGRTRCRNIAEELAMRLRMNYVFGREFDELSQQTCNARAFHGQATLSRYPQANARLIRFRHQSNFWRPRWFLPQTAPFQVRLGGRIALITDIEISEGEIVKVYNVHLESRGNDKLRLAQLHEAVCDASKHAPWGALCPRRRLQFRRSTSQIGCNPRRVCRTEKCNGSFGGEHDSRRIPEAPTTHRLGVCLGTDPSK